MIGPLITGTVGTPVTRDETDPSRLTRQAGEKTAQPGLLLCQAAGLAKVHVKDVLPLAVVTFTTVPAFLVLIPVVGTWNTIFVPMSLVRLLMAVLPTFTVALPRCVPVRVMFWPRTAGAGAQAVSVGAFR